MIEFRETVTGKRSGEYSSIEDEVKSFFCMQRLACKELEYSEVQVDGSFVIIVSDKAGFENALETAKEVKVKEKTAQISEEMALFNSLFLFENFRQKLLDKKVHLKRRK